MERSSPNNHDKFEQSKCLHMKGCDFTSVPNRANDEPNNMNNHLVHQYNCQSCKINTYSCLKCNRHSKRKCEFNRNPCTENGNAQHTSTQRKRNKFTTLHRGRCELLSNTHVQGINLNNGNNEVHCQNQLVSENCNKKDVMSHNLLVSDGGNYSVEYNNDTYDIQNETIEDVAYSVIQNETNDDTDSRIVVTNLIETHDWGNNSARRFFSDEHKNTHNGLHSIVNRAINRKGEDIELMSRDTDYHVLSACLFKGLTRNQTRMLISFINETVRRENDQDNHTEEITHQFIRRVYTEGPRSICKNMPIPVAKPGDNNFAIVSVVNSAEHILGNGVPLKTLDYCDISHWKNDKDCFHSLFHQELYAKIGDIENRPNQLRIHQIYIWSDGFQKNSLVKRKTSSLQLFIIYFVPPDGTRDIEIYTAPFALGQKQKHHQHILNLVLQQTSELQKVRSMYCGATKKFVNVYFTLVMFQNDQIERVNNLGVVQGGTYGKLYGYSLEFNSKKTKSCQICINSRIQNLYNITSTRSNMCPHCSDWWNGIGKNTNGNMTKPDSYPTIQQTTFKNDLVDENTVPYPPNERTISISKTLPPCKLSFSFLIKAFVYAKFQYQNGNWTKENTRTYLRTCCFNGDIITKLLENEHQSVIPELWLKHEEYGIEIENFPDAPMHLLFLGIQKHLLANVERLFHNKKDHFREFSTIISMHLQYGSKLSIDWCNMTQFSDKEGITTVGWQSDQYLAIARMSLVYFGLLDDYCAVIDKKKIDSLQQVMVLWYMLLSALFTNDTCNAKLVDDCVRLFLSACTHYGETTIQEVSKGTKKGKNKGEAAFFKDTSNYFSLLNLKQLIERFGSIRILWEGEREKFIKYVKKEIHTICDTESFMPGVFNNLLCTNKMNEFLKKNQFHEELLYSKTRNFRVYKDYNDFDENYRSGMMLSGVIMKSEVNGKEDIFICYKGNTRNTYVLNKVDFDDIQHKTKLCLYYSVIRISNEVGNCLFHFDSRDSLIKAISGFVIIQPMITKDMKYKISNGHTVLTYCWRVRTNDGICDFLPTVSGFVFN